MACSALPSINMRLKVRPGHFRLQVGAMERAPPCRVSGVRDRRQAMKIDLSGKIAIVTGSTEGIGFAVAKGLAEAGATVVVNGRTGPKVDAAVAPLGGSAPGVAADLGAPEGHAALVAAEPQADIVVSN